MLLIDKSVEQLCVHGVQPGKTKINAALLHAHRKRHIHMCRKKVTRFCSPRKIAFLFDAG